MGSFDGLTTASSVSETLDVFPLSRIIRIYNVFGILRLRMFLRGPANTFSQWRPGLLTGASASPRKIDELEEPVSRERFPKRSFPKPASPLNHAQLAKFSSLPKSERILLNCECGKSSKLGSETLGKESRTGALFHESFRDRRIHSNICVVK